MSATRKRGPGPDGRGPDEDAPFPFAGFFVLALVIVLAVTTETMPTGLLPEMSASLGVPGPEIGLLVTVYALTVAATSIPLIRLTRTWPRHLLVAAAVLELGLSVVLSAAAPDYGWLLVTRLLGGLGHAVFWATVGAFPGHAVAREHIARAVAMSLGGATVGFVLGLPISTSVGQAIGWRPTFALVGVLLVLGAVAAHQRLPRIPAPRAAPARSGTDATVVPVLLVCALALVAMTGHYAFSTYVAAYSRSLLGVPATTLAGLLLLNGLAGAVGLVCAAAFLADRPERGVLLGLGISMAAIAVLACTSQKPWIALPAMLLWSAGFGMLPTLLQTHLLHRSSAAFRDAGNAIYTATFNIGIGGGALIGALLYSTTGLAALPWFDVVVLGLSAAVLTAGRSLAPRVGAAIDPAQRRPRAPEPHAQPQEEP